MKPIDSTQAANPVLPSIFLSFAVFGAAYFMSYALRAVNAVVGGDIAQQFNLGPQTLGFLTAAYLATFALMQLPVGVALDRYGARWVQLVLLLIAALGCAVFALSESVWGLIIGRSLIGVGVSACLMAAFASYRQWYAPELQGRLAAWMLVVGTSGALAATVPTRILADALTWRGVFVVSAVILVLVAAAVFLALPKHRRLTPASAQDSSYLNIIKRQGFIATAPIGFFMNGGFIALQTLWAGPWLADVVGLGKGGAAHSLLWMNAVLLMVYLTLGAVAPRLSIRLERRMVFGFYSVAVLSLIAVTFWRTPSSAMLWPVLAGAHAAGMLLQARFSVSLPKAIAGRGNVTLNMAIFVGAFVLQWLLGAVVQYLLGRGISSADALAQAMWLLAVLQAASMVWLWWHWRKPVNFDSA